MVYYGIEGGVIPMGLLWWGVTGGEHGWFTLMSEAEETLVRWMLDGVGVCGIALALALAMAEVTVCDCDNAAKRHSFPMPNVAVIIWVKGDTW